MSDSFTEVTRTGLGGRLKGAIMGALFGILLFFGSFVVIWITEGRTDYSKIAEDSIAIVSDDVSGTNEGELVAANGRLTTNTPATDPDYLNGGTYIELSRDVEMYAWVERTRSETDRNVGGSETTTTEYYYEKEWVDSPKSSDSFRVPQGHQNPSLTINDASYYAENVKLGAFSLPFIDRLQLPSSEALPLTSQMVKANTPLEGNYIFFGDGSLSSPQIGDVRISYQAVPADIQVTLFGKQEGSQLVPFVDGDDSLYRAYAGTRDEGIAAMKSEYTTSGWIGRIAGFFMMWIGLSLILSPISTFLDILPLLGNVSRWMFGAITFAIAFVLWLVTVIISIILHNIWVLLIVIALLGGGFFFWQKSQAGKTAVA